jgi:hypothetical protein
MAMCNADGSGFLSGGTDCSPQFCSAGACTDGILNENFEDGTYSHWTAATTNYTIKVASPGANGSNYALTMTKTIPGTVPDGLSYTFPTGVQPHVISYWVNAAAASTSAFGYFRVVNGTDILFYSYFASYLYLNYSTSYLVSMMPTIWYHVELRNIDWTLRKFDLYVNGTSVALAATFGGTSTSLTSVQLFSSAMGVAAYWDEILFQ